MVILRKKTIIIASLVLLLFVIAIVNYSFNREIASEKNLTFVKEDSDEPAEDIQQPEGELTLDSENGEGMEIETSSEKLVSSSFFIQSRLDRDKNRSFYIETLNSIVSDEKVDPEVRKMAQNEMITLIKRSETERIIENLIKAKGFKDALVIMSDESVNVIVNAEKLTPAQVAQIKDIVCREAKVKMDKIKIIEKQ